MKRECRVAGCGGMVAAKGWCSKHYQRWVNYRDPSVDRTSETGRKLTADDVREIRHLATTGWTGASLARVYGVSRQAISLILNRRTWTDVDD